MHEMKLTRSRSRFINKMKIFKYLFYFWMITIFVVSSIPDISAGSLSLNADGLSLRLDYLFHFLVYLILTLTFFLWKIEEPKKKIMLQIFLIATIFALIDEFHQKIIPGRTFNPYDIFYNFLGIWVGLLIIFTTKKRITKSFLFRKLNLILQKLEK